MQDEKRRLMSIFPLLRLRVFLVLFVLAMVKKSQVPSIIDASEASESVHHPDSGQGQDRPRQVPRAPDPGAQVYR